MMKLQREKELESAESEMSWKLLFNGGVQGVCCIGLRELDLLYKTVIVSL